MKIMNHIYDLVRNRINAEESEARTACNEACNASHDKLKAQMAKLYGKPFTADQHAKIRDAMVSGHDIYARDLRTKAQAKVAQVRWEEHRNREKAADRKFKAIRTRLNKLHVNVCADLELCKDEDEQRAVIARFKTHPLDKAWVIPKRPHTVED